MQERAGAEEAAKERVELLGVKWRKARRNSERIKQGKPPIQNKGRPKGTKNKPKVYGDESDDDITPTAGNDDMDDDMMI